MSPFNFNVDPINIARTFWRYVRAMVWILGCIVVALASIAITYVAVRGMWIMVNMILKSIGA